MTPFPNFGFFPSKPSTLLICSFVIPNIRSIVAGENNQRIIVDPVISQRLHNLTDTPIHGAYHSGVDTGAVIGEIVPDRFKILPGCL